MANQPFSFNAPDNREEVKRSVVQADSGKLQDQLNIISRRLKVIEERYSNMDRKTQMTDQNMLSSHRKINTEMKAITEEIAELRAGVAHVKEDMELVIAELKSCAKKEDVDVLEKYLRLWEPIKFVTRAQVEKMISEATSERKL
ncbi:MAG: hypothetical protein ABIG95_01255 [Candidatus Woesearchaeota archaeon]